MLNVYSITNYMSQNDSTCRLAQIVDNMQTIFRLQCLLKTYIKLHKEHLCLKYIVTVVGQLVGKFEPYQHRCDISQNTSKQDMVSITRLNQLQRSTYNSLHGSLLSLLLVIWPSTITTIHTLGITKINGTDFVMHVSHYLMERVTSLSWKDISLKHLLVHSIKTFFI